MPPEKTQQYLQMVDEIKDNKNTVMGLVKQDTYPNNCQFLKGLGESQRVELLEFCLVKERLMLEG